MGAGQLAVGRLAYFAETSENARDELIKIHYSLSPVT